MKVKKKRKIMSLEKRATGRLLGNVINKYVLELG